jgi:outer membrane cobalamin receptor
VYLWDGSQYRDKSMQAKKGAAVADLNLGAEFAVMPRLNLWLQMNNLLNTRYQRWNQYSVLGFTVLGGVVYSFR